MLKRFKKLGFLLVLLVIGFLFYATPLGKILGHWSLFYVGLFLIILCFFMALKIVGMPPLIGNFLKPKNINKSGE